MNKTSLFALSALLLLSACDTGPAQAPLSEAPLAGATIGGDFLLTDQDGKKRRFKEFDGKFRIVYFGYTNCPDICTPDMQNLMAGLKSFETKSGYLVSKDFRPNTLIWRARYNRFSSLWILRATRVRF